MEVKNNYAHVTTQRILNKFIEINFSVGCMVWLWCCLFQPNETTSKNIDEILFSGPIHVDYFLLHWWYLSLFSQLPIVGPLYQFWPWNCLVDLWTQWKIWQKTILQVNNFQKLPFALIFIKKFERFVRAKSSEFIYSEKASFGVK